ncbi:ribosomal-processing cysteine protease Prp [Sporolactobacillus sp. KGMB 08714]|uniref:ribosomal-processing cysteine protease Prp n=1 Tax=Sporolactobacillus sp. KGMB 08714 TaxID=3064704 RepID=UPI002FBEA7A6
MIILTVDRNRKREITAFKLTGHAGSGPYGYDLVCAAVSAVSFGALNAVESLTGTRMKVRQAEQGGFLECTCPEDAAEDVRNKTQLILEAMLVSMKTIETSYGDYIKIHDEGGAGHAET